jgi:hypothetical protein
MTFEKLATCNIPTSEWAALKWLRKGRGVLSCAEGKSAGWRRPRMHHYTTGKRPFQTKVKFELARKEQKRAWTRLSKAIINSLKSSSTSIWPCVCQKRLRSCLKCLAWVPPQLCRICHFSRNCFDTNRVPRLYEFFFKKKT